MRALACRRCVSTAAAHCGFSPRRRIDIDQRRRAVDVHTRPQRQVDGTLGQARRQRPEPRHLVRRALQRRSAAAAARLRQLLGRAHGGGAARWALPAAVATLAHLWVAAAVGIARAGLQVAGAAALVLGTWPAVRFPGRETGGSALGAAAPGSTEACQTGGVLPRRAQLTHPWSHRSSRSAAPRASSVRLPRPARTTTRSTGLAPPPAAPPRLQPAARAASARRAPFVVVVLFDTATERAVGAGVVVTSTK